MNPVIRVVDVSKRFTLHHATTMRDRVFHRRDTDDEDFWALRGVSLELDPSRTLGLIGPNGSGKTTLLKLIGGILTPTSGFIERRGRLAALLELGAGFHTDLTGRENIYLNASILGLSKKQTDDYFDAIVDFSGIGRFIDNPVKFYSNGMYIRLAFSVAVHVEPEILLVDEVLAVGDEPFQRKCIARIKSFQSEGRSIILVTHALEMVRELCDRAVMLERGEIVVEGSPQDAVRAFRERHAPETVQQAAEEGDRRIAIAGYAITDGDGQARDRFEPGDGLRVEVVLEAHEPVDDPVIGIAIYNHLDMLVYGTNTELRGIELGRIDGRRRVTFSFGAIAMMEGQYFVTLGVHNRGDTLRYHWLDRVASFKVFTAVPEPGLVHLNTDVAVVGSD
jgi:ABC-2 type transport system ATP-binding protein